jgi:hypothetical protein
MSKSAILDTVSLEYELNVRPRLTLRKKLALFIKKYSH